MKKILITGKNSFIGKYFKQNCNYAEVSEISLIDNNSSEIDYSNYDAVFHVAAIVHQDTSISDNKYYEVNSDLAYNTAYKAKLDGVKQFVFMSTVKVYGENSSIDRPWTEDSVCTPVDAYGKSKLDAEKRLMVLNDDSFKVSIIRTPVVYGANVKGNIQKISKFVVNNRLVPFNGIDNKRAMVYIGNLVYLINEVIKQAKAGVFLANDKENVSTSQFVKKIINEINGYRLFLPIPKLFQEVIRIIKPSFYSRLFGSMVINNSKTIKELKLIIPYKVEDGIKEVVNGL